MVFIYIDSTFRYKAVNWVYIEMDADATIFVGLALPVISLLIILKYTCWLETFFLAFLYFIRNSLHPFIECHFMLV